MILVKRHTQSIKCQIVFTFVTAVFLFVYYTRCGDLSTNLIPLNIDKPDNIFYVNRFKLFNDFLELSGRYGHHKVNSSWKHGGTRLKLEGLESLIHKIKPAILQDEKLETAILPFEKFFEVRKRVEEIDCNKIFKGDKTEVKRARILAKTESKTREQISPEEYINITTNCSAFKGNRGYILSPMTKVEEEFPIAFSIIMYKDIWQFERLLRAIYRPQNLYCLHVDNKTEAVIFQAVLRISQCFDNVFISSKRFNVQWGQMTMIEPELSCMEDLWNKSKTWKYFINLTGQEFPLRTNYELVQVLKAYNGANDIEGTRSANRERWDNAGPPPEGIEPTKGAVHVIACREYVDFVLHDQRVQDVLNWTRYTRIPDETFFATLNHNPSLNIPGSFKGFPETEKTTIKPFLARFKNWGGVPCAGKRVRSICIFGIGDLPLLAQRKELFANKFYFDFERFALDCMEELHFNNTRDEYLGKRVFDSRWYSTLGFVLNKVDS